MLYPSLYSFLSFNSPSEIHRSRKPIPSFGRAAATDDAPIFGSDYTKPQTYQTLPKMKRESRPRPPVNARQDVDQVDGPSPWSNTLKNDRSLKPWEKEALEHEAYQGSTADEPFRPSTAPKPKITQIFTQSTARTQQSAAPRSVSPAVARKPQRSPVRSPVPNYHNSYEPSGGVSGPPEPQPNIVHLQYNSPMGLYSSSNIRDAYVGQTQGRASKPAS